MTVTLMLFAFVGAVLKGFVVLARALILALPTRGFGRLAKEVRPKICVEKTTKLVVVFLLAKIIGSVILV